ncbi:MAG TPA: PHP domain-containing protein, partial [Solirubrobacteraceae bacterium]|nr:PHP domain-containing protein [Solirubrobacteraceae bacterium]
MAGAPYTELHCHSAFSFLDGASLPYELAQRAGELGYDALALTDHNSVSGSMEMAQAASEHGIRAIHGAEIDLAPEAGMERRPISANAGMERRRHLTLLVRDERGWRNLCRVLTHAHAHTRDGSARRELGEPRVELKFLLEHAEGLVCLTGCAERSALRGEMRHGTLQKGLAARL